MRTGRIATAETRAAFAALTQPHPAASAGAPMRRSPTRRRFSARGDRAARAERRRDDAIAEAYRVVLTARETGAPVTLVPRLVDGEPSQLIALTQPHAHGLAVTPLFVAITATMTITPRRSAAEDDVPMGEVPQP